MIVGVPKEIKVQEYRVGMSPPGVRELVRSGHDVLVETAAGHIIGFEDSDYAAAGARVVASPEEIYREAGLIVKVKEPQPAELAMLREGQVIFTYLHLAPDPALTQRLLESGCVAIAYETVTDAHGGLPLLAPMSEVAGRMAVQAGASCLEIERGGRGVLLGGVPGVLPAKVVVIGGGVVGVNAVFVAAGMGANVTVIDKNMRRLAELDFQFQSLVGTRYSTTDAIEQEVLAADLVIGAVLVPGAASPKLVTAEHVRAMKRGSVIVDVAIDQGGCCETSRPTTHDDPTYLVDGVVHYCVANMPGAVARTSTLALNYATLPFVQALADKGYVQAMRDDPHLMAGLNVHRRTLTYGAVADAQALPYTAAAEALAG